MSSKHALSARNQGQFWGHALFTKLLASLLDKNFREYCYQIVTATTNYMCRRAPLRLARFGREEEKGMRLAAMGDEELWAACYTIY